MMREKCLQICENIPLARLTEKAPVLFFRDHPEVIKDGYEWFYLEIFSGDEHLLLILSVADPFRSNKSEQGCTPASIYSTWYSKDELISYSYVHYDEPSSHQFRIALSRWLNGEEESLELFLPEHSLKRVLWVELKRPVSLEKEVTSDVNAPFSEKKHIWQCLVLHEKIVFSASVFSVEKNSSLDLNAHHTRSGAFFDVPLASKLARSRDKTLRNKEGTVYLDHNAGIEKLWTIPNGWAWWHCSDDDFKEVGYYFPHANDGFVTFEKNKIISTQLFSQGSSPQLSGFKNTAFNVSYPSLLRTQTEGSLASGPSIESAPFYLRKNLERRVSAPGSARVTEKIGTLEVLVPRKVNSWFCQQLFSARIVKSKRFYSRESMGDSRTLNEVCQRITQANGKSFYLASHVLGKDVKKRAYFVYALCRLLDDATDTDISLDKNSYLNGAAGSEDFLKSLWGDSQIELQAQKLRVFLRPVLEQATGWPFSENQVKVFLLEAREYIDKMSLSQRCFEELLLGQKMDENFKSIENFSGFYVYCFRVAGVVGILMAKIFSAQETPETQASAEHLGIAMQITNILRDVREDFERGRIYLPADELNKKHLDIALELKNDVSSAAMVEFLKNYCKKAQAYYHSALAGVQGIPSYRARICVRLMVAVYGAIAAEILKNPGLAFKRRTVISSRRRIFISLQVLLGRNPVRAAGFKGNGSFHEL